MTTAHRCAADNCPKAAKYKFTGSGAGRTVKTYACENHRSIAWDAVRRFPMRTEQLLNPPANAPDDQPTLFD